MSDAISLAQRASAQMHADDHCAAMLGIDVQAVEPGFAVLTMTVKPEYANGHGMCQGGLISTLADTAFAHACNSTNRKTVAQRFSIDFIRPAMVGELLTATAEQITRGKLTGICQVKVTNPNNKLIALFSGTSFEIGGEIVSEQNTGE